MNYNHEWHYVIYRMSYICSKCKAEVCEEIFRGISREDFNTIDIYMPIHTITVLRSGNPGVCELPKGKEIESAICMDTDDHYHSDTNEHNNSTNIMTATRIFLS